MSEPKPLTDPDLHNQALGMIRDAYCVTIKCDEAWSFLMPNGMSVSAARALDANRRRKKPKPQ